MIHIGSPLPRILLSASLDATAAAMAHVSLPLSIICVHCTCARSTVSAASGGFCCQYPSTRTFVFTPLAVVVKAFCKASVDTRPTTQATSKLSTVLITVCESVHT
eukprot:CAMPEP_0172787886 /NCGR_PEP_ID=MMETSP1074-20121228/206676_1 /TAXON_ID=2916 /ORGANISM="Ceratium fusus, Strain PA161109" /LENGTH=104 /DNA_ID=CAMNT_0013624907 /DNA_START=873 /DNA_END=1184 /DNA_ORIENTATION=-